MNQQKIVEFIETNQDKIAGWFFKLDQLIFFELFAMQTNSNLGGDIAEVGVYQAKSLVLLTLLRNSDEKAFGFDLFQGDDEQIAWDNLQRYGDDKQVELIKGKTSDLDSVKLDAMLTRPLRMLHIDAGHEYHEVLEQLRIFAPYVADAGIIAMDDYQDREFPGIEAAVLDFAELDRPRRFVPFLSGGNKLYLCSSHLAIKFQRALLSRPLFKDSCRLTRVRDFNVLIAKSKLPVRSDSIAGQLNSMEHPQKGDRGLNLNELGKKYAQITFGSGAS